MPNNLDRFRKDLDALIGQGKRLGLAMEYECDPDPFRIEAIKVYGGSGEADSAIKALPSFREEYQRWYSESLALLRQLLPDRLPDFVRYYEKPKGRKEIDYESYRIEDYLQSLTVTRGVGETLVDTSAAQPQFRQQLAILNAAKARFESSLFDIRKLVQADLLDSEIEAAEHLAKHKFVRAAGAVAGVVLERHLSHICSDRNLPILKKNPTISDFNEALKASGAVDVPQWRFTQHLADIRNLCDHGRSPEPTADQVADLLAGVRKVIKTIY